MTRLLICDVPACDNAHELPAEYGWVEMGSDWRTYFTGAGAVDLCPAHSQELNDAQDAAERHVLGEI